jgi:hypothetical protein
MKSYNLMRSEPDVNTCRSNKTFYYVDGVRVARDQYDSLYARATRKDCLWTRKSERGRWLHGLCVYA